jgi:hypothetical protein
VDLLEAVKISFYFALTVLVLCLLPLIYQAYHVLANARRVSDRMEFMTDVKSWWPYLKKLTGWFSATPDK